MNRGSVLLALLHRPRDLTALGFAASSIRLLFAKSRDAIYVHNSMGAWPTICAHWKLCFGLCCDPEDFSKPWQRHNLQSACFTSKLLPFPQYSFSNWILGRNEWNNKPICMSALCHWEVLKVYKCQSSRAYYSAGKRKHTQRTNLIHKTWYSIVKQQDEDKDRKHFRSEGAFITASLHLLQSPVLFWLPWWQESTEIPY